MIRRWLGILIAVLPGIAGLAGAGYAYVLCSSKGWIEALPERFGRPIEEMIDQGQALLLLAAAVWLVGYVLTFGRRFPNRSLAFTLPGLAGLGVAGGMLLWAALAYYKVLGVNPVSDIRAIGLMAAGGLLGPALIAAFEWANRAGWAALGKYADEADQRGLGLLAGRMSLLFAPGQPQMLRVVALAEFQAGQRGETAEQLVRFYEEGRRDPDLLEALCQYAHELKSPERYLEYLAALQEAVPDDPVLRKGLFDEFVEQARYEEAIDFIRRVGVPADDEVQEKLATVLCIRGEYREAVDIARRIGAREGIPFRVSQKILREVLTRASEFVPALNLLAEQADRMAMREQRQKWLERSLEADPRQSDVRAALRGIYKATNQPQKLFQLLRTIIETSPADVVAWIEFLDALANTGKFEEGLQQMEVFEKLHGARPASMQIHMRMLFESNDLEAARLQAKALLEHEAASDEQRQAARQSLAQIDRVQLTTELATLVERANQNPDDLELQVQVLERLLAGHHTEKVISLVERLTALRPESRAAITTAFQRHVDDPSFPFALLDFLANLQVQGACYDDALATVERMARRSMDAMATLRDGTTKILRRSPHHLPTLLRLGVAYQERGQLTEMIHHYAIYLANGGEETQAIRHALASAYLSLDDYANAKRYVFRAGESTAASDVPYLRRLVSLAIKSGESEEAAEMFKRIELIDPASPESRELKAEVDRGLGSKRFAFLQREVEAGRGGAELLEELGDVAVELQNYNDAITYFQRASREPSIGRRAKVKLAWVFSRKRLFDVAAETLAEVSLSLDDDPKEMVVLMDKIYEIALMYQEARHHDRALKLFKLLLRIDAGFRDVLKRVEMLN